MKNYRYTGLLAFIIGFFIIIVSCEDETSTNDTPDQLFRPALLTAAINSNEVTLSWVPIANASYLLEISRDSFLFENELQIFTLDGIEEYTVDNLWSNIRYSCRIKAVSKDETIQDSEYKQITFLTGTENIFYTVPDSDIGVNSVLLKWDSSKEVSKILIYEEGILVNTITLSSTDVSEGEKLIEALNPGTDYVFKIYLGEMVRGTLSVTTKTY